MNSTENISIENAFYDGVLGQWKDKPEWKTMNFNLDILQMFYWKPVENCTDAGNPVGEYTEALWIIFIQSSGTKTSKYIELESRFYKTTTSYSYVQNQYIWRQ